MFSQQDRESELRSKMGAEVKGLKAQTMTNIWSRFQYEKRHGECCDWMMARRCGGTGQWRRGAAVAATPATRGGVVPRHSHSSRRGVTTATLQPGT